MIASHSRLLEAICAGLAFWYFGMLVQVSFPMILIGAGLYGMALGIITVREIEYDD